MNAEQKVRKAMQWIMDDSEVNASQVYKGNGGDGYGWYFCKFGMTPTFIGASLTEALEWLEEATTIRQEYNY